MIERNYSDDPNQFKSLWLNENNPKGVIINFPEFKKSIRPVGSENPSELGWYEHDDKQHKYLLSKDTSVDSDKKYFQNGELIYTDEDIEDDSFNLKRSLQSGSDVDFIGCISATMDFKVANDFKYLLDQKVTATLTVTELAEDEINNVVWKFHAFTGFVDEIKRDKSRDLIRQITCHDFLYRLLDNYDVTNWYVWQYGDSDEETTLKHSIYDLRNSFWNYIANTGTEYDPAGQAIEKRGEGWDQVTTCSLINDDLLIPKTLNVTPVDFEQYISGERVGGPFERHPKDKESPVGTQYDVYVNGIIYGWDVSDLVARKQIIELGLVGTLWSYTDPNTGTVYTDDIDHRKYMDCCDTYYEATGNPLCGIQATIKIPREEQEKVRETQITASTVLQAFCQFNGVFGLINGEGYFDYIKLNLDNPTEIDEQYQLEVGYSDTTFPSITGVVIFDKTSEEYTDDSIHTEYGDVKNGKKGSALAYYPDNREKIEGPKAHVYTIDDNFLMNSFTQSDAMAMAERLYNQISNLTMRNTNLSIVAMPWLNCGEAICYYSPTEDTLFPSEDLFPSENLFPSDFQKITTLIMNYEISGTGLFKGKIECKVEDMSSDITDLNEIISSELFYRKIGDDKNFSEIEQTAERIRLQVTDAINNVTSKIEVEVGRINLEIDGPDGLKSQILMTQNSIQLLSQQITLEAQRIDLIASESVDIKTRLLTVEANEITLEASKVSFIDLATGGKTVIEGSNIKTGSISCDRIKLSRITVDGRTYDIKWASQSVVGFDYLNYGLEDVTINSVDASNPLTITRDPNTGAVMDVTLNSSAVIVARFIPTGSTNTPKAYGINNIQASRFLYLGSEPETST